MIEHFSYNVAMRFAKQNKICVIIPVWNEGERIQSQLRKMKYLGEMALVDVVLADGISTDSSLNQEILEECHVRGVLSTEVRGQSPALQMGFDFALKEGYEGVITVDGNNKDSVEDIPMFVKKLCEGYDFVQGSRWAKGGVAQNTPLGRTLSVRYIHNPMVNIASRYWKFTDTTNGFRGYSRNYLAHSGASLFRDVFQTYEMYIYLPVRAGQLKLKITEIPVRRNYPSKGPVPSKINSVSGHFKILFLLFKVCLGFCNPKTKKIK